MRDTFLRCSIVGDLAVGTKQPQFRSQSQTDFFFIFYFFFTLEGNSVVDIRNACIIAKLLNCLVFLCSGRVHLLTKARWRTNTWQEMQVKYCLFSADFSIALCLNNTCHFTELPKPEVYTRQRGELVFVSYWLRKSARFHLLALNVLTVSSKSDWKMNCWVK